MLRRNVMKMTGQKIKYKAARAQRNSSVRLTLAGNPADGNERASRCRKDIVRMYGHGCRRRFDRGVQTWLKVNAAVQNPVYR